MTRINLSPLRRLHLYFVCIGLIAAFAGTAAAQGTKASPSLRKKLKNIIIPKISFEDTPVSTVLKFLKDRSRELDPDGSGINFLLLLRAPKQTKQAPRKRSKSDKGKDKKEEEYEEPTVTMEFNNIPLGEAIRYICVGAGLRYKSEEHAVVIMAPGIAHSNFETRFFSIDPRLFTPSLRKHLSEL